MGGVTMASPQRFVVLDSFRGLCALCVVVFHLHILNSFTELAFFRSAGLFVEFFFTLSGFVLCHSYAQRVFDFERLRSYLISRTFRIFPLHLVLLLLFTGLEFARAGFDLRVLLASYGMQAEWLPNFLLLQAWLPQTNAFSFNGPAWSISVEFYVYLIFGAVLLATVARQRFAVFAVIAGVCTLCVLVKTGFVPKGGFRGITCFFLGALAYQVYQQTRAWRISAHLLHLFEIAALIGIYFCLTLQYESRSFVASCFFALCILLFAREAGLVSRLLQQPAFVKLGHWSFSIYLTHYLLVHLAVQMALWLEDRSDASWIRVEQPEGSYLQYLDTGSPWGNTLLGLAVLALSLWISSLSYRHIEQRGMALGKRVSQRWGANHPAARAS